jgi:hypothetical protein
MSSSKASVLEAKHWLCSIYDLNQQCLSKSQNTVKTETYTHTHTHTHTPFLITSPFLLSFNYVHLAYCTYTDEGLANLIII